MYESIIDNKSLSGIMTPEEVARFLKKSTSWVYKNWQRLGGVKLGGSLFFPRKEDLYEHIFCHSAVNPSLVEFYFFKESEIF